MTERPWGIQQHYICPKGNEHVLSHVMDWGPAEQNYHDHCRVEITIEAGHVATLKVLPDKEPEYLKR